MKKSTRRSFEAGESIIVIGASMGGLHALSTIVSELPSEYQIPVVLVQHRNEESKDLAACLQQHSSLPVREPEDKEQISPGKIYVAPAGYHLMVERVFFELSTEGKVHYSRPSIDVLFASAAYHFGKETIGVILTGANEDGAEGLSMIKKRGGLTIVQNPENAQMKAMPAAAIQRCKVDMILPLSEIGPFLASIQCNNQKITGAACN
jgi:two-component system chemotaxis response regulator CheB